MPAIVEMRTYRISPGKRDQFLKTFESRAIPAHREIGMQVVGPFLALDDPDTFFWIRAFPDQASRDSMKSEFYDGSLWKDELEDLMLPMLEQYHVVLVEDTHGLLRE
jgi:NIPSNAP